MIGTVIIVALRALPCLRPILRPILRPFLLSCLLPLITVSFAGAASANNTAIEDGSPAKGTNTHAPGQVSPAGCDIALDFLPAKTNDGVLFTNPGKTSRIRLRATNVGSAACPRLALKLLRYKGRQGWVEGKQAALPGLAPGRSQMLTWQVNPEHEGFYTYKPQFVGGLIDANLPNHKPEKRFKAIYSRK